MRVNRPMPAHQRSLICWLAYTVGSVHHSLLPWVWNLPCGVSVVTVWRGLMNVAPTSTCVPGSSVRPATLLYMTDGETGSAVTSVPIAFPRALPSLMP